MSHIDSIKSAAQAPQAIWLQFVTAYRPDRHDLYLFVEGLDGMSYFYPLARSRSRSGIATIFPCWNKDGVLRILRDIRSKSRHARHCGFIVDRDFDDIVGKACPIDSALLVTDYYSLENHISCESVIEVVWTEIWALPKSDPRLSAVQEYCALATESLFRCALPIMAWILWHRRHHVPLNLQNIPEDKLFRVFEDGSVRRYPNALSCLKKSGSSAGQPQPSLRELLAEARLLRELSGKHRTRGKYEMFILVRALNNVFRALETLKGVPGGKPHPVAVITHTNLIRLIGGKAPYPLEWVSFIDKVADPST